MKRPALALLCLATACAALARRSPLESAEILDRPGTQAKVEVKHVLIGWSWLGSGYRRMGMTLDPRAEKRTESQADDLAKELLAKCRAGSPIEPMMKEWSEDGGSTDGRSYPVTPESRMSLAFKDLALRLQPGECGLVKSEFGWHMMKRVG